MKFKTNKFSFNCAIVTALLTIRFPVFAVMGDTKKSINIESDVQSLDIQNNIITFTGHVVMMHGTIKISADKVVVTRHRREKGKEIIDSYGNPVLFYQMQDNGNILKGCALHMHYELAKDLLILTGNAYLEQSDSSIISDKIIFMVKKQKMQACSEKGKRVTTVLIPSRLKGKQ